MIAFSLWPINIHWYGIFYAISFILWYFLIKYIIEKTDFVNIINKKEFLDDILYYIILGVLLGWRLGYVFFYNLSYFIHQPRKIFYIWNWGMAFAGAFIGVWIAIYLLARKYKLSIFAVSDLIVWFLPFWLWLWRIWNYLNQELYWKVCNTYIVNHFGFMCKYFWTNQLHFANQLLESFLEWWLLFIIFQYLIWKKRILLNRWFITIFFIIYYSIVRFLLEFIRRHPKDYILYFWLSRSQYLMILIFILWIVLLVLKYKKFKFNK